MHKRNDFLDVIKGILILFILITHYSWTSDERAAYFFPFWIDMAVPIFMIISGYVSALSFQKNQIRTFEMAFTPKLLAQKAIRYTFPYAIAFIIEAALLLIRGSDMPWVSGFLTGGFGPGSYYYPVLMQLIFVFPAIYFIIKKYHKKGLLLCGGMNLVFEICHWAYGMNVECYRLLVFRYILVIAVGCYVALEEKAFRRKTSIALTILGVAFITMYNYWGYTPKVLMHWTNTSFVACLYIIPITGFAISRIHIRGGVFAILGKASYNIFLVQMVYYQMVASYVYARVDSRLVELGIGMVCCLAVGIVFYYIETPITKWLIKKVKECHITNGEMVNG